MQFGGRDAHLEEGPGGEGGGDDDGVGVAVDGLFAEGVAGVADGLVDLPALVFLGEEILLEALVGGASIADEDAATRLEEPAGLEAGAGDGDEGVAGGEAAEGVLVEGEGVGVAEVVVEPAGEEMVPAQEVLGRVKPGEGLDFGAGDGFAGEAGAGPGGEDGGEMAAGIQLAGEIEVMEDAEDGLDDAHEPFRDDSRGSTTFRNRRRFGV